MVFCRGILNAVHLPVSALVAGKLLAPIVIVLALTVFMTMQALPAAACGGLVAPDGPVRLERAATLVAWHDGIEHSMTAFTYRGRCLVPGLDSASSHCA